MTNRAIEFHDSTLLSVVLEGRDMRIAVSAYGHESEGEPGRDAGTGWEQDVDFILTSAVAETMLPQGRMEIQTVGSMPTIRYSLAPCPFPARTPVPFGWNSKSSVAHFALSREGFAWSSAASLGSWKTFHRSDETGVVAR